MSTIALSEKTARTEFQAAIRAGNIHNVITLATGGARTPSQALPGAALFAHTDLVSRLLEMGADVHERNDLALFHAIRNADFPLVEVLLAAHADPNARGHEAIRYLLQVQTDIARSPDWAEKCARVTSALISYGFNLEGTAPLIVEWALVHGAADLLEQIDGKSGYLCDMGSDALAMAVRSNRQNIVNFLMRKGLLCKDLPAQSVRYAVAADFSDMIQLLLENGLRNHVDFGQLLCVASGAGSLQTAELLLLEGAKPNYCNGKPLLRAALSRQEKMVELLLTKGARPLANRRAALRAAAKYGNLEIVKILAAASNQIPAQQRPRRWKVGELPKKALAARLILEAYREGHLDLDAPSLPISDLGRVRHFRLARVAGLHRHLLTLCRHVAMYVTRKEIVAGFSYFIRTRKLVHANIPPEVTAHLL